MSVDKLVDSSQLNADLTTVANAIRTKGGTSAQLSFPSGMAQAIADIPASEIIYRTTREGTYYYSNMVYTGYLAFANVSYAPELLSYQNDCNGLLGTYILRDNPKLETVICPKATGFGNYVTVGSSNLRTVTLGNIGYPITTAATFDLRYGVGANPTVTLYVNAETMAAIPSAVTSKQPFGFGSSTVIIYRSSNTGEVITS